MQKPLFTKSRRYAAPDSNASRDNNAVDALESLDDDTDEDVVSFDEVEEHTEYDDMNPDGDDAEDEMFLDAPIGESLMDDVDAYLEEEYEDEDEEDDA